MGSPPLVGAYRPPNNPPHRAQPAAHAALFLDSEKFGPNGKDDKFKNMQFHEALYWATITLTS
jgi:hypothetical protein